MTHNKMHNNNQLFEALEYKDLEGMMKPTVHIDEFASKMGDDDDIIVASFFVRSKEAATDLSNWFEKGYDFVLDADESPGEISPGRFLVYVELRRRRQAGAHVHELISDLSTLTEFEPDDWTMHYNDKTVPFSQEEFERLVPLNPNDYRLRKEKDLNTVREAAGLPVRQIFDRTPDILILQSAAGIR